MTIEVSLVYSPAPRIVWEKNLTLAEGSTVREAVRASGLIEAFPDMELQAIAVGVWGRKRPLNHALGDQDRIEIYRALKVDPKVARRERFVSQGVKKSGLFARKREGSKPGY